jgi:hypothetical protein
MLPGLVLASVIAALQAWQGDAGEPPESLHASDVSAPEAS